MQGLFTEESYENAIIELFRNLGYTYVYGPDIDYRDFTSPLYNEVLIESLHRLNPNLPEDAINDALYKLKNFENGTLVQKNSVFMDYLQNGIEVKYTQNGEDRSSIAYEIYSRMCGGKSLFPNDYASIMSKEVKESKFLYQEYFEICCEEHNLNNDEFYKKIEKQGYCLSDKKWGIYDQAKYMINREIDDNIIPFLNTCIIPRGYSKPK